jgi:hypothetical protein
VPRFLSDEWFDAVDKLRAEAGDVPIPDAIKNVQMNIVVKDHPAGGEKQIHLVGGEFKRGLLAAAPTKLTVPYAVAKAIFVDNDPQAGMQAFMSGQIQIEGDMAVMMQMQAAGTPSPQAQALQAKVKAITEA